MTFQGVPPHSPPSAWYAMMNVCSRRSPKANDDGINKSADKPNNNCSKSKRELGLAEETMQCMFVCVSEVYECLSVCVQRPINSPGSRLCVQTLCNSPLGRLWSGLTTLREQRKWPTSSGNSTLRLCYSTISCTHICTHMYICMHVPGVHMQRNWHSRTTGAPLVEPLRSHSLSDSLLFRVNASATLRTTLVAGSAVFWAQHTLVTIW